MRIEKWFITAMGAISLIIMAGANCYSQDAQNFCRTIHSVEAQAPSGFKSFRGSRSEVDDNFYRSTFTLPNARRCDVFVRESGATSFICTWELEAEDASKSKPQATTLFEGIKACYTDFYEIADEEKDSQTAGELETEEGVEFTVSFEDNPTRRRQKPNVRLVVRFRPH